MRLRLLLPLTLMLLVVIDHNHGVPEVASTLADASSIGKLLTTGNTIRTTRQGSNLCECKGREGQTAYIPCLRQKPMRRSVRCKWRKLCLRKKNRNVKKCRLFSKAKRGGNTNRFGPSVPI